MPRKVRAIGDLREAEADGAHVLLELAVAVDAHLLADLGVLRLTDLNLLVLAHERELALARGRIRCAGGRQRAHDGGRWGPSAPLQPPRNTTVDRRAIARGKQA